jgi:hypothetical protein
MLPCRRRRAAELRAFVCCLSILSLSIFGLTGAAFAQKNKPPKQKKKKNVPGASASGSPGEQSLTNIPLPIGHEAKGLVLPDFDVNGRMVGKFEAGKARRIDQEHVGFEDLKITTFTPENKIDLQVDMHTSVFDLTTKVLKSQERTTIRRADFNIVGDAVQFDTNTRTGHLVGNVKMVITDQSHLMEKPGE